MAEVTIDLGDTQDHNDYLSARDLGVETTPCVILRP
jgi:hypothetical protein